MKTTFASASAVVAAIALTTIASSTNLVEVSNQIVASNSEIVSTIFTSFTLKANSWNFTETLQAVPLRMDLFDLLFGLFGR